MTVLRGVAFALLCLVGAGARADEWDPHLRVALGYHFSTGDYGSSDTTDITYVPLTVRGEIGPWRAEATIPYLAIRSSGSGLAEGPNGPVSGTGDGLGDILLAGSYTFAPHWWWMPWVEVGGLVKLPTASRGDGLGTRELDFGVATDLTWAIGRWSPFATVGYRFLGSPPGTNLRDVVGASGGAQYRCFDWLSAGLLIDFRQRSSAASGVRLDLVPFAGVSWRPHWALNLYGSAGLADGSPDAGTGVEIAYTY